MSLIKKWVNGWAGSAYSDPSLGDYMFGAFMFMMALFFVAVFGFLVAMIIWAAWPWSVPTVGFIVAILAVFWYAWKREQEPKTKTKRVKI